VTTFSFSTDAPAEVKAGVLILPVFQGPEFGPGVEETGLQQAYKDAKLIGKKGESLLVTKRNGDRFAAGAVLLHGVGERGDFDATAMRKALGRVASSVGRFGHAATTFPQAVDGETGDLVQAAAEGLGLGGYRFDRYKSKNEHAPLKKVTLVGTGKADAKAGRQAARRAEVTIAARYPEHKRTPASASATQEIYTLFGSAVASAQGTRRLVGVEAQGMTACPCAQQLVASRSRERLEEEGFDEDEIERVLRSVPVATHNQRGIGRLHVGCPEGCAETVEAAVLLGIVERSMSSEIFELMKRSDEVEVVEKAHMHPRFVEDCVREMVRMAVETFGHLGERAYVAARQENLETIHKHNVVAERYGLLGELARELSDDVRSPHDVTMREWLDDRPPLR
jgi:GTP cyclohydrolase I/GTP cyclohydrolase-4